MWFQALFLSLLAMREVIADKAGKMSEIDVVDYYLNNPHSLPRNSMFATQVP
jgi:hypothetical protein